MQTEHDTPPRTTRFSDVCGTTDELKRLLYEERERGCRRAGPSYASW